LGEQVNVVHWAEENIGDTHLGKRKTKIPPSRSKGKKNKEGVMMRRKFLGVRIAHQSLVMIHMVVVMMTMTTTMMAMMVVMTMMMTMMEVEVLLGVGVLLVVVLLLVV